MMGKFKSIKFETFEVLGGTRGTIEFDNGYGASIIRNKMSYGREKGLYEVAVTLNDRLCYDTPVTDDVIGWLTPSGVDEVLDQIRSLPPAE